MNKNNKVIFISQNIKKIRLKEGLTQQEFADKVNIKRASLGQIETLVASPTLSLIIDIIEVFNVKYENLISENFDFVNLRNDVNLSKEIELKNQIITYQTEIINNLKDKK